MSAKCEGHNDNPQQEYPELKYIKDTQSFLRAFIVGGRGSVSQDTMLEDLLNAIRAIMTAAGGCIVQGCVVGPASACS